MSDLYRLITEEQWEQIPRHERAGYVVSGGVMVKVKPTDRICTYHDRLVPLEWETCFEGDEYKEPCHMVDLVRVEDV